MISLNQNETNIVVLTLNEKNVGSNPYFLQLYSNQNKDNTLLELTGDTSTNVNRYNRYEIDETPLNLIVGQYDYFVHQFSGSTVAMSASTNIVESGKCVVFGTGTTTTTFENNNEEYTFV
jgi:hypothetical protein